MHGQRGSEPVTEGRCGRRHQTPGGAPATTRWPEAPRGWAQAAAESQGTALCSWASRAVVGMRADQQTPGCLCFCSASNELDLDGWLADVPTGQQRATEQFLTRRRPQSLAPWGTAGRPCLPGHTRCSSWGKTPPSIGDADQSWAGAELLRCLLHALPTRPPPANQHLPLRPLNGA